MLHLPTSIVPSIFNPLVLHAPNCLCLAHLKLTSRLKFSIRSFRNAARSLWIKLPTTLRSLFTEATHANPVPFPSLSLSHQQFLKHLKTHLFTLLSSLVSFHPSGLYLFDQSLPIPCYCIECPRIYHRQLVLWAL